MDTMVFKVCAPRVKYPMFTERVFLYCFVLYGMSSRASTNSIVCTTFYSTRSRQLHCGTGLDRWPQGSWIHILKVPTDQE
jgi:hypothetical protein